MKQALLSAFFGMLFLPFSVYSQCTPDSSITGLYSPTEQEGLPGGLTYVPYEAVITISVPTDTTYLSITATVDSLVLTGVDGLPPGLEYDCNPGNCQFPGGSLGCIRVFGTVDSNIYAGTYDIDADFQFYLQNPSISLPYTISEYSISIDSVPLSVGESKITREFSIDPNPVQSDGMVRMQLPSQNASYSLDVYSIIGARVAHLESSPSSDMVMMSVDQLVQEPGIYLISLSQDDYQRSIRLIVQE